MCEKYNGWTNYETWAVKLWMDNDEGSYTYYREEALRLSKDAYPDRTAHDLANSIKESHENYLDDTVVMAKFGVFADLLTAALSSVNWHEIAKSLLEDIEED
jgi:hypothetical protein